MRDERRTSGPDRLLVDCLSLFEAESLSGPVIDLACGDGHNGIYLSAKGLQVILADGSQKALDEAKRLAEKQGAKVILWQVDLEKNEENPLHEDYYGAILMFRYLHRPLFPCIKKALKRGGLLIYETFTVDQPRFGKPRNPDFLLKPGELLKWFEGWVALHYFEGILEDPKRAIAQLVCRKPA